MEVKNQIQFTNITKVLIKNLNKSMNQLKNNQLVLVFVHDCDEV